MAGPEEIRACRGALRCTSTSLSPPSPSTPRVPFPVGGAREDARLQLADGGLGVASPPCAAPTGLQFGRARARARGWDGTLIALAFRRSACARCPGSSPAASARSSTATDVTYALSTGARSCLPRVFCGSGLKRRHAQARSRGSRGCEPRDGDRAGGADEARTANCIARRHQPSMPLPTLQRRCDIALALERIERLLGELPWRRSDEASFGGA